MATNCGQLCAPLLPKGQNSTHGGSEVPSTQSSNTGPLFPVIIDRKMEEDLNKTDHQDKNIIEYLKSLNKQSKRSNFLHQIQHKNNYKQEYSLRKWIENYGRKKYLLSFSCLSYDVHKNLLEQRSFSLRDLDFCSESPVYCSKFGESQNTKSILCLGYESGQIYLQKIRKKRKSDEIIVKTGHIDAVYDIAWIPNENSLLSASADSYIILWQLKNEDLFKVQTFFSGSSYVKSVSSNPWDRTSYARQPVKNSVKGLSFSEEHKIVSAGASDGKVKIWDLRKTYSTRKRLPHSLWNLSLPTYSGTTSMSLSPFKERIYVSCLNGKIYCFHITAPTIYPVAVYFGFSRYNIHCKSCVSPCGSYLLSGSGDAGAQIWSTNSPGCPIVSLSGHEELVTTVAWSEDDMFVTCDDIKYRIFKCDNASQINLEKKHEDIIGFAESMYEKCFFEESLSQKTGIESAECVTHGISLTKSTTEELVKKFHMRNFPDTLPQMCLTPSSSKSKSIGEKTPKTEEKGTLLSWLSSSKKTPNSNTDSLLVTPKSGKSPSKSITSKRRLSVLLEDNQENINEEDKKPALSPTKNILSERENRKNRLSTTAKMLKYDDLLEKRKKSESEVSDDDFELINDASHTKDSKFLSLGMDTACEEQKFYPYSGATTPVRSSSINPRTPSHLSPVNTCLLTSPTANLPNYVVDGRSPHNRGESPKIQKREVDWLTSLRKKNSFAKGMEHLIKNEKVKSNRKK
ncbi:Protein lethal(2)denticleless [Armadillidium nasatum]|uniref:Protein lethal(2)denticleless n=1 Tax=Armadillidium nasatum TaxID=96803 RepID=A0A5N5SZS9_9CRUS|nr:Protein lethal(2)denticleless [Armadillidium nasatum]